MKKKKSAPDPARLFPSPPGPHLLKGQGRGAEGHNPPITLFSLFRRTMGLEGGMSDF